MTPELRAGTRTERTVANELPELDEDIVCPGLPVIRYAWRPSDLVRREGEEVGKLAQHVMKLAMANPLAQRGVMH